MCNSNCCCKPKSFSVTDEFKDKERDLVKKLNYLWKKLWGNRAQVRRETNSPWSK